jgi:UPF0042 nucleotide-binding protein
MDRPRRLTLMTFGFKYGTPNTNYYFDVSFLKNPARETQWGLFASPDEAMREWVLSQPLCQSFLDTTVPLVRLLLEADDDVRIGLGCNSGRHRSVIVASELARRLKDDNVAVRIVNREEVVQ